MYRFCLLAAACTTIIAGSPALAQRAAASEAAASPVVVTGTVALASDCRLRGVSQTDKDAAVQGSLTVTHETGLYAGAWASNLAGWGTFGGSKGQDGIGSIADGVVVASLTASF